MEPRQNPMVVKIPQPLTSSAPRTPHTPETPQCRKQSSSPLRSPSATPLKKTRRKKNQSTNPGNVWTPKPNLITTCLPQGIRPHLLLDDVSARKRFRLNVSMLRTQFHLDKFRRIVEWDGTWISTLALPRYEFCPDVKYFEDVFPSTYPCAGQFARRHEFWREGPELESGLSVDSFEAVDPDPLLTPEAVFNFAGYYMEHGEPGGQTAHERLAWEFQSQKLREMVSRASIETCSRSKNGTQSQWLNQR